MIDELTKKGDIYYFESKPYTGIGFDVYNTGSLFIEVNYKQGIMGLIKYYHNNGQLEKEGVLKGGKQEGLWKYYDENGILWREITFKDDNPVSSICWDKKGDVINCFPSIKTIDLPQTTIEIYEKDTINSDFEKNLREEYGLSKEEEIIFKPQN